MQRNGLNPNNKIPSLEIEDGSYRVTTAELMAVNTRHEDVNLTQKQAAHFFKAGDGTIAEDINRGYQARNTYQRILEDELNIDKEDLTDPNVLSSLSDMWQKTPEADRYQLILKHLKKEYSAQQAEQIAAAYTQSNNYIIKELLEFNLSSFFPTAFEFSSDNFVVNGEIYLEIKLTNAVIVDKNIFNMDPIGKLPDSRCVFKLVEKIVEIIVEKTVDGRVEQHVEQRLQYGYELQFIESKSEALINFLKDKITDKEFITTVKESAANAPLLAASSQYSASAASPALLAPEMIIPVSDPVVAHSNNPMLLIVRGLIKKVEVTLEATPASNKDKQALLEQAQNDLNALADKQTFDTVIISQLRAKAKQIEGFDSALSNDIYEFIKKIVRVNSVINTINKLEKIPAYRALTSDTDFYSKITAIVNAAKDILEKDKVSPNNNIYANNALKALATLFSEESADSTATPSELLALSVDARKMTAWKLAISTLPAKSELASVMADLTNAINNTNYETALKKATAAARTRDENKAAELLAASSNVERARIKSAYASRTNLAAHDDEMKKAAKRVIAAAIDAKENDNAPITKITQVLNATTQLLTVPNKENVTQYSVTAQRIGRYSWGRVLGGTMAMLAGSATIVLSGLAMAMSAGVATPVGVFGIVAGTALAISGFAYFKSGVASVPSKQAAALRNTMKTFSNYGVARYDNITESSDNLSATIHKLGIHDERGKTAAAVAQEVMLVSTTESLKSIRETRVANVSKIYAHILWETNALLNNPTRQHVDQYKKLAASLHSKSDKEISKSMTAFVAAIEHSLTAETRAAAQARAEQEAQIAAQRETEAHEAAAQAVLAEQKARADAEAKKLARDEAAKAAAQAIIDAKMADSRSKVEAAETVFAEAAARLAAAKAELEAAKHESENAKQLPEKLAFEGWGQKAPSTIDNSQKGTGFITAAEIAERKSQSQLDLLQKAAQVSQADKVAKEAAVAAQKAKEEAAKLEASSRTPTPDSALDSGKSIGVSEKENSAASSSTSSYGSFNSFWKPNSGTETPSTTPRFNNKKS